jgi:hypothetical protein
MIDATLKDAAAMAMSADNDAVGSDSIEDELSVRRLEMIETFLDHMISVKILDEPDDLTGEGIDDETNLECR